MASFTGRMIGAAKLDIHTYEEVEADRTATGQAMAVVVLSSVALGVGSGIQAGLGGLLFGALSALIGWAIWAFLTYIIGTKFLPEPQTKSDMGELLRTIGFAATPGLLYILVGIPALGVVVGFVVSIWMLVAFVIAVRQALDYRSTWRAVGVCVIGYIAYAIIFGLLSRLLGVGRAA